ncbi:MAG: hypothetical protein ACLQVJ_06915 [Syntrophobacteraceae bacterium]
MAKKKINDDRLLQLIRDGNSPAGAARRLGVGRAAVSKRLKALKIGVTRELTARFIRRAVLCVPAPRSRFLLLASRSLSFLPLLLPLLVAVSIAASGCRFASLNPFMVRYYRLMAGVERDLRIRFFTIHYSRFTIDDSHWSLFTDHCASSQKIGRRTRGISRWLRGSTRTRS